MDTGEDGLLPAALDSAPVAIIVVDEKCLIVYRNDMGARLVGDALGSPLDDACGTMVAGDGSPIEPGQDPAARTLATGEPVTGQIVGLVHDGQTVWLRCTTRLIDDGAERYVSLTATDVTGQRQTEARLRGRIRIDEMLTQLSTHLLELGPAEAEAGVELVLAEVSRLLGAQRAAVFLRDHDDYHATFTWSRSGLNEGRIPPSINSGELPWITKRLTAGRVLLIRSIDDLPPEAERDRKALRASGISAATIAPLVRSDEVLRVMAFDQVGGDLADNDYLIPALRLVAEMTTSMLARARADGAVAAVTSSLRRSNQALRTANERLAAANRAKDEFVSVASHELRTPLTSILGFAETIVTHEAVLSDEQRSSYLRIIRDHASRLRRLVDDLLESSRLAEGKVEAVPAVVDLGRVVDDAALSVTDLDLRLHDVHGTTAFVDPELLRRILTNLLENAAKYGEPPYEIRAEASGELVDLTVRDHGPGVPPGFEASLFDRFTQASHGTTRTAQGTGLGLAIVRDLARLSGGDVRYESADPGARFRVTLPRRPPKNDRSSADDSGPRTPRTT